jgi:Ca2+-binding EF-hand superfamily protein
MRQSCLRVQDLFAMVDHDRSGTVDKHELQKALRSMKVDLDDTHFSALFRYLDTGGNGEIDAEELEVNSTPHFYSCILKF